MTINFDKLLKAKPEPCKQPVTRHAGTESVATELMRHPGVHSIAAADAHGREYSVPEKITMAARIPRTTKYGG